jgi:FtsP/CotA-like multicopper oxidase with cupredoxin domain
MHYQEDQSTPIGSDTKLFESDRRRFLQMAAAAGIALPFCTNIAQAVGPRHQSPRPVLVPQIWEIEAARVVNTFLDSSSLPFHRYRALGSTPVAGSVPILAGTAGQVAELRVTNTLPYTIQPMIVGGALGPQIAPGAKAVFQFVIPSEGTWILTDNMLGDAAGPMGLGAVVISRSASKLRRRLQQNDREYVLMYTDSDDRWNNAIDSGSTPNFALYEPNYHTVNNLSYPNTAADPATAITCQVGDRVLIRMCNLGWVRHAIHFHGYHVDIQKINNQPQSIYGPKDTVPLPGHTTLEVLLNVIQPGVFPVHPHSLTCVTDNGLYAGGQLALIMAS